MNRLPVRLTARPVPPPRSLPSLSITDRQLASAQRLALTLAQATGTTGYHDSRRLHQRGNFGRSVWVLRWRFSSRACRLADAEHFDEVWLDADRPRWRRLHPDTVTALLGTDLSDQSGGN